MKTAGWIPVLLALSAGCASQARIQARPPPATDPVSEVSAAVHWTRSAAEHEAIFLQTYRAAEVRLRELVAGRPAGSWAVILDADETVLDNSTFQLRLERRGLAYNEEIWNDWVREEAASALPGAVEFTRLVSRLGGRVAIVTNREMVVCPETRRNLESEGVAADVVLCRDETGDKNPRFEAVRNGRGTQLPAAEVVMWIGDNIGDFPGASQATRAGAGGADRFGRDWFVLPNPMYGSWESVPVREEVAR